MRRFAFVLAVAISAACCQATQAQLQNTDNTNSGNISGQTGQSENFTITRDNSAFIGGSATNILGGGQAGGAGASGLGTAGLLGGLSGFGGFGRGTQNFLNQFNQQRNTTTEPRIRFRVTVGFSHPRPGGSQLSAQLARRLSRIPSLESARSVAVTMEQRTAVLAGQVATEREKRLIEQLAMMEPGVSEVRNELTVKPASETLPPLEATN